MEEQQHLKIFVSAYACEPGLGSEIGVGWHWVMEMSRYVELWVLTRASNRPAIEAWMERHPEQTGIHFLYFDLPKWARWWKKGLRGVRTYYNLWQCASNRLVKRTMQENGIKVFHHLTYGNVLWKVSAYGQQQCFIWGPVGGLETIPKEYTRHYGWKSRLIEALRRTVVAWAPCNRAFVRRCRRASLILCKTEATRRQIPPSYAGKAVLFTDVAADVACSPEQSAGKEEHEVTRLVTVGRLDAWRGFDLVIEAMAAAIEMKARLHLTIVGDGPDRLRLEKMVRSHALETCVTFTGKVPMEVYRKRMEEADVVVNAALKEGAVTVSFDCMAMGKPLLCIDTGGYTRSFTDEYAVIVPRTDRVSVVDGLKRGILRLTDAEERRRLGHRAREVAAGFAWEQHGKVMKELIERVCQEKQLKDGAG